MCDFVKMKNDVDKGVRALRRALREGDDAAKTAAALALLAFFGYDDDGYGTIPAGIAIVKAGGIPPLVKLLRNGSADLNFAAWVLGNFARDNAANAVAIAAAVGFDALVELARRGHVNVGAARPVRNATLPVKRKAALVAGQLLEAAAPRTRVPREIKAAIASYL